VQPHRYRPQWLNLAEAKAELIRKGFPPSEAEDQLFRGIGGEALRVRLNRGDIDIGYLARAIGQSWLRNPKLDFDQSTIVVPLPRRPPLMSETEQTLAMLARLYAPSAPPIIDEIPILIEVMAEDLDRLWPDPLPAQVHRQIVKGASAPPSAKRRRGPPARVLSRVLQAMEQRFGPSFSELADRETWSDQKLGDVFKTSRTTARRAREWLLSKLSEFDQN
jgi:hypothetical protein